MEKFNKEQAIERLEKLTREYSENNKDNPTGLVSIADEPNCRAIIAKSISYSMMAKILYIVNRSEQEYFITALDNNVVFKIRFFR